MVGDEVRAHEGSAETMSIMDAASSDSGAATAPVSLGRGNTGSIGSRWRETEDLRKLNAGGGRTITQQWAMHQHSIEGAHGENCPWIRMCLRQAWLALHLKLLQPKLCKQIQQRHNP